MNKTRPILQSSFHILNTYLSSVILIYLCEENILGIYTQPLRLRSYGILLAAPIYLFKFLIYSGIYGALVELSSGEEYCVTLGRFGRNIRSFWPAWFCRS